jgi:hypothetical protein
MNEVLIILGFIICLISLFAIILPDMLMRIVRNINITTPLRLLAFVIRVLLGIIFILVAGSTQFPVTLQIVGVVIILTGIIVLFASNARIQSFMDWILGLGTNIVRVGGVAGIIFGGFLIYSLI